MAREVWDVQLEVTTELDELRDQAIAVTELRRDIAGYCRVIVKRQRIRAWQDDLSEHAQHLTEFLSLTADHLPAPGAMLEQASELWNEASAGLFTIGSHTASNAHDAAFLLGRQAKRLARAAGFPVATRSTPGRVAARRGRKQPSRAASQTQARNLLELLADELPVNLNRLIAAIRLEAAKARESLRSRTAGVGGGPATTPPPHLPTGPAWSKPFTLTELAEFFGRSPKRIRDHLKKIGITCDRLGHQSFRIDKSGLDATTRARFERKLEQFHV